MDFFSRWFCFYDDSIQTGYSQCKHVKWQYYAMKHEKAHQMREIYKLFGVFRCGRFMLALFFFWFDGVQNTPFLVSWANADFLLFLSDICFSTGVPYFFSLVHFNLHFSFLFLVYCCRVFVGMIYALFVYIYIAWIYEITSKIHAIDVCWIPHHLMHSHHME